LFDHRRSDVYRHAEFKIIKIHSFTSIIISQYAAWQETGPAVHPAGSSASFAFKFGGHLATK
jgi:hypothetical protein